MTAAAIAQPPVIVSFSGTPELARAAARARLRAVGANLPGRWRQQWAHVSSVMTSELLAGRKMSAADLYAAALVLRLARWELAARLAEGAVLTPSGMSR